MANRSVKFSVVNPFACGIDIGSKNHFVCIGKSKDSVREFSVFTQSHHEMARWLNANNIKTVAMESTGFYWKNLFLLL